MRKFLSPSWFQRPSLKILLEAFSERDGKIRFVGGCVRDSLLERPVEDIDLATCYRPEDVIRFLEQAHLKTLTIGFDHGTVGAVIQGDLYEITTLRRDVETFGRHATVSFTDDWRADASRRDFTINALFLSPDGELFDYFDGVGDLKVGRVRFIGRAEERIQEDYLRILRFFRFQGRYGQGKSDTEAMHAISKHISSLKTLSAERIREELLKIFSGPRLVSLVKIMAEAGCFRVLFEVEEVDEEALGRLIALEERFQIPPKPLLRLAVLFHKEENLSDILGKALKLSNRHRDYLRALEDLEEMPLHENLYRRGTSLTLDRTVLKVGCGRQPEEELKSIKDAISQWHLPFFPLKGSDLIALGMKEGPALGHLLRQIEQYWIDEKFLPDDKQCLEKARTLL